MNRTALRATAWLLTLLVGTAALAQTAGDRRFNGPYTGWHLGRTAFPIGGMGAGMFCLEGTAAVSHVSLQHRMEFFNEPTVFAALALGGDAQRPPVARVLEGPVPEWKYFGRAGTGNGGSGTTYGLPRFRKAEFLARFPFAEIQLRDEALPVEVDITGWSPFTPPDADASSLPVGAIEYHFRNRGDRPLEAVFSFHARNFMGKGPIGPIAGGFVLHAAGGDERPALAAFVDGRPAKVDHCWFKGGWWDALTIAWHNVESAATVENPPVAGEAPGASLYVPLVLPPGKTETVRLLLAWFAPTSTLRQNRSSQGPAFQSRPSKGTAQGQQPVAGFLGNGLVNTFDPSGDGATGTLTSPEFVVNNRFLHFLVGGGSHAGQTCVNLRVGGKVVATATGPDTERLAWTTFRLEPLAGKTATIEIVDRHTGPWGHILADHFVLSDEPIAALRAGEQNALVADPRRAAVLQDFESGDWGGWRAEPPAVAAAAAACCPGGGTCCPPTKTPEHYVPWYATRFGSLDEVAAHWRQNYAELYARSRTFSRAFYDTTLPAEVVEAVAANLTILKTPTVLRQHDGRLWCWEGCSDNSGCCAGSCTHVWNYAQAICHLFPALERGLRQTEYGESQEATGRQAFRANLPIAPGGLMFDAADGQLGGIMKAYREWRIGGDDAWMATIWPAVKQSLEYAIATWDPRHTGLLEEDHHNTYDISYFGPDGHCGSFYLGALAAAVRMGEACGADVALYRELLAKGRRRMETELFNGEYFVQRVMKEGLDRNFQPIKHEDQSPAYRAVAARINQQGPKYQYGEGCLSDGVLGLWMAAMCGLDEALVDPAKVERHLLAVYRHNLKHDLSAHANPQRPTYAMGDDGGLLLCTWPRGGKPLLPFVYSDEVWTGIEYQVAAHLILLGRVDEGLDIVRTCRRRYDGARRNPFNEYECGHWYARAMSSYGLLQALTGVRYDAATKTLYVRSRVGNFRSFLATATGFGTVAWRDGKATVDVAAGTIAVEKVAAAAAERP